MVLCIDLDALPARCSNPSEPDCYKPGHYIDDPPPAAGHGAGSPLGRHLQPLLPQPEGGTSGLPLEATGGQDSLLRGHEGRTFSLPLVGTGGKSSSSSRAVTWTGGGGYSRGGVAPGGYAAEKDWRFGDGGEQWRWNGSEGSDEQEERRGLLRSALDSVSHALLLCRAAD